MNVAPSAHVALRREERVHRDADGRTERVETVEREPYVAPAQQTNVNAGAVAAYDAVVVITRVVMLVFTVLEVLLLFRFGFKLAGANASQPLVAWLYGLTEPLVRPFQGIFPEPRTPTVVDIPALLAILFLFLISWLIVALVRAIAGRTVA